MQKWFSILLPVLFLLSCTSRETRSRHVIGVSQCSADIWREKQNGELRMGAYLTDGVELRFASAYDSDERQVQQIDSLIREGIDLLIVAPNQVQTISPAIDRAYDKGIPVIVFERKTSSKKYTAFMSADNYEMGRVMGNYIAHRLEGHGRVLEIKGLRGSSPAIERHHGFVDALAAYPGITIVDTLQGDWTEQSAYEATQQCLKSHAAASDKYPDFVFGQNDRMAMGARRAILNSLPSGASTPRFCGIDGLPGEGGGIQLVRDSVLDATYIYPTHGDQLLQLAVDILEGKPYAKETALMSALVTPQNARVLLLQAEEIQRQTKYLDELHQRSDTYLQQLSTQRMVNVLSGTLIVLLLALVVIVYRYYLQRIRLHEERTRMEREQLEFYNQAAHQLRTPLTLIEGPLTQLAAKPAMEQAGAEVQGLMSILQRNTLQLSQLISRMLDVQAGKGITAFATTELQLLSGSTEEAAGSPSPTTEGDERVTGLKPTLLIVDDNADIRALLRTILQEQYEVSEAADGQQGLRLVSEMVPDLIVSDVMMPVMNGLEFCQRVKSTAASSHIPVILLTARAMSKHQIEGYESGADAYITKPFEASVLKARINNLLHSRQQLRDLFTTPNAPSEGDTDTRLPQEEKAETSTDSKQSSTAVLPQREDAFLTQLRTYIEDHMNNSELSVEDIAADMAFSRVQLYRKVKALTGQSPVELLRKARLVRAHQLLETTSMNVSEVAYTVGFSAPSYFTKCYKEEYGQNPTEVRRS